MRFLSDKTNTRTETNIERSERKSVVFLMQSLSENKMNFDPCQTQTVIENGYLFRQIQITIEIFLFLYPFP